MMYLVILGFVLVGLPLGTILARDVDKRGGDGRVVGAVTFVLPPLGLVLWLASRTTGAFMGRGAGPTPPGR